MSYKQIKLTHERQSNYDELRGVWIGIGRPSSLQVVWNELHGANSCTVWRYWFVSFSSVLMRGENKWPSAGICIWLADSILPDPRLHTGFKMQIFLILKKKKRHVNRSHWLFKNSLFKSSVLKPIKGKFLKNEFLWVDRIFCRPWGFPNSDGKNSYHCKIGLLR